MKVKTNKKFYDRKERVMREVGKTFEVNKERFKEIQRFVEEVKEVKKKK